MGVQETILFYTLLSADGREFEEGSKNMSFWWLIDRKKIDIAESMDQVIGEKRIYEYNFQTSREYSQ